MPLPTKDLTNQQFGEWTVLNKAPSKHKGTMWFCLCSCGTARAVSSSHLISQESKSCGHSKDLTNQQFGEWTVLNRAPNDNKGKTVWFCRCSCSITRAISAHTLLAGTSKSCGLGHGAKEAKAPGGYIYVYALAHPRRHRRSGRMLQHIVVMEKMIGRLLRPGETVHHKNGIRHDNRPKNLELRSGNHGKGARVEDLIEHALSTLKLYAPHRLAQTGTKRRRTLPTYG